MDNASSDLEVTDQEFFQALRAIAMWGDIDELPAEPDDLPQGTELRNAGFDREQELRELFSAVFARLARGEELPKEIGVAKELAVVNRWIRQRRGAP